MHYLVIERFREGAVPEIYQRLRERGRLMPPGLDYVSSWIDLELKVCYQIMQTEKRALLDQWLKNWGDLFNAEIIPVRTSAETAALVAAQVPSTAAPPTRP